MDFFIGVGYFCLQPDSSKAGKVKSKHSGNSKHCILSEVSALYPCLLLVFPALPALSLLLSPLQQFLFPLHCLRSAHLPMEVDANASTLHQLPQGSLKAEALQEPSSWGLSTTTMSGSYHFHSGFVAQRNFHFPEQGWRTPVEAARDPSTVNTLHTGGGKDQGELSSGSDLCTKCSHFSAAGTTGAQRRKAKRAWSLRGSGEVHT